MLFFNTSPNIRATCRVTSGLHDPGQCNVTTWCIRFGVHFRACIPCISKYFTRRSKASGQAYSVSVHVYKLFVNRFFTAGSRASSRISCLQGFIWSVQLHNLEMSSVQYACRYTPCLWPCTNLCVVSLKWIRPPRRIAFVKVVKQ